MSQDDVVAILKERCAAAGGRCRFASTHKISHSLIYRVERYQIKPTPQVLTALGLRKVVSFEPIR